AAIVIAFQHSLHLGLVTLTVLVGITPWIIYLAIKLWPKTIIGKMMIIGLPKSRHDILPDTPEIQELRAMIGQIGISETNLMPSGTVLIQGKRFDAHCRSGLIDRGSVVAVIGTQMGHLIVTKTDASLPPLSPPVTDPESQSVAERELSQETTPAQTQSADAAQRNQPVNLPTWSLSDEQILNQTLEDIDLSDGDEGKK
ncbi:MAG: hypothetical protein RLY14_1375, partial [Planctomycetota bacterium]